MDGYSIYPFLTGDLLDQERAELLAFLLERGTALSEVEVQAFMQSVKQLWKAKEGIVSAWEERSFHFLMHYLSDIDIMQTNAEYREKMSNDLRRYASECQDPLLTRQPDSV